MLKVFKPSLIAACATIIVLALSGCGNSASFQNTGKALSKSITVLNHEPIVKHVGFSSDPTKDLFKLAISVSNDAVTTSQLNDIINTYLIAVQNSGMTPNTTSDIEFLQPYNLNIEVYHNTLNGKLMFTGQKLQGANSITWSKQ